jgi:hypothetical protein
MMTERLLERFNFLVATLCPRILTGLTTVIEVKGESTRKRDEGGNVAPGSTGSTDFLPPIREFEFRSRYIRVPNCAWRGRTGKL